jgi:hypothetical protein
MVRIEKRELRPIKVHRMVGRQRTQVGEVMAFNLPDAIRRWWAENRGTPGWRGDVVFQANVASFTTETGEVMTYVATD